MRDPDIILDDGTEVFFKDTLIPAEVAARQRDAYDHATRSAMALRVMEDLGIQDNCTLCGELVGADEAAEMGDPNDPLNGGLVHAQCGLDAGWEIS
jgi:hypothetical protein